MKFLQEKRTAQCSRPSTTSGTAPKVQILCLLTIWFLNFEFVHAWNSSSSSIFLQPIKIVSPKKAGNKAVKDLQFAKYINDT